MLDQWIAALAAIGLIIAPTAARADDKFSSKAGLVDATRAHVFNQICGDHMVLAQIGEMMDNGAVTEIVMRCQPVDVHGNWSGGTSKYSLVAMREKAYPFDSHVFDGKWADASCPPDSWVIGFNAGTATVTKGGPKRDVVWIHRLMCASYTTAPTEEGFDWPIDAAKQRYVGFDGVGGARSCGPNEVGVGIWSAVSGEYIEAFGLICQRRLGVMGTPPSNPALVQRLSPSLRVRHQPLSPASIAQLHAMAPKPCFAAGPNGCIQH
jgi:hypothetical protein